MTILNLTNTLMKIFQSRIHAPFQNRVFDHHGLHMIDLSQSTGLFIANGRLSDDQSIGKLMFCSQLGQITVDYLLLNF